MSATLKLPMIFGEIFVDTSRPFLRFSPQSWRPCIVKQLIVSSRSSRDARRHLPLQTIFVLGVAKQAEPYIPCRIPTCFRNRRDRDDIDENDGWLGVAI